MGVKLTIVIKFLQVAAWGQGPWREGGGNVWAPEEVYFPTLLALLGHLRADGEDVVKRACVTFASWYVLSLFLPLRFFYFFL